MMKLTLLRNSPCITSSVLGLKMAIINGTVFDGNVLNDFLLNLLHQSRKSKQGILKLPRKEQIKSQKQIEKVYHDISVQDAYLKVVSMKKLYTMHKFEAFKNAFGKKFLAQLQKLTKFITQITVKI